jgi:hypothetical protein
VSLIQRCPHFTGQFALKTTVWDKMRCPYFTGCPHFAGSLFTGFTVHCNIGPHIKEAQQQKIVKLVGVSFLVLVLWKLIDLHKMKRKKKKKKNPYLDTVGELESGVFSQCEGYLEQIIHKPKFSPIIIKKH